MINNVIELVSPEKGTAAKRYADIISFEEMCGRVELQYLHPLSHLEYWGITMLKDFIIYERYGQFFVIPYSAVQLVDPCWTKRRSYSRECSVAIQDTLSHWYVIVCEDRDEKEKLIHNLNAVLQRVREEGNYL